MFVNASGLRFFEPEDVPNFLDHAGFDHNPPQTNGVAFFAGATRR